MDVFSFFYLNSDFLIVVIVYLKLKIHQLIYQVLHQLNNLVESDLLVKMDDFYKQNQMLWLSKHFHSEFVLFEKYILNVVIMDHVLNEIYLQLIQFVHELIDHQYI